MELEGKLAALYAREPEIVTEAARGRANLERMLALAGLGENHPVWKTVLSYADEMGRNEQAAALMPDLTDDRRQYRAGRAAAMLDFATALRELRWEADRRSAKG